MDDEEYEDSHAWDDLNYDDYEDEFDLCGIDLMNDEEDCLQGAHQG